MSFELQSLVLSVPFNRHLRLEGEGDWLSLDLTEDVSNHIGTMHAGALFTLAEAASGLCAMRVLGGLFVEARAVTRSATIEYRKPAVGRIRAVAEPVRPVDDVLRALEQERRANLDIVVKLIDRVDVEVAELRITWALRKAAG